MHQAHMLGSQPAHLGGEDLHALLGASLGLLQVDDSVAGRARWIAGLPHLGARYLRTSGEVCVVEGGIDRRTKVQRQRAYRLVAPTFCMLFRAHSFPGSCLIPDR